MINFEYMSHANQGIYDIDGSLFAYELLYRDERGCYPESACPLRATSSVIMQSCHSGLAVTPQKLFVNFDRKAISMKLFKSLRPDKYYIEILETAIPTTRVDYMRLFSELSEARGMGYTLVLDDFSLEGLERWGDIFKLVSIIKIDIKETCIYSRSTRKAIVALYQKYPHLIFLAEKIETQRELQRCVSLGFRFFQGFYFDRPKLCSARVLVPSGNALKGAFQYLNSLNLSSDLSPFGLLNENSKVLLLLLLRLYCYNHGNEDVMAITCQVRLEKIRRELIAYLKPFSLFIEDETHRENTQRIFLGGA